MENPTVESLTEYLRQCWNWCAAHGMTDAEICRLANEEVRVGSTVDRLSDGWADDKTPETICREVFDQSA